MGLKATFVFKFVFLGFFFFFICFSLSFFVFLSFCLFFFVFLRFSPHSSRTRANNCNLVANGEFHSDPVCRPHSELLGSVVAIASLDITHFAHQIRDVL